MQYDAILSNLRAKKCQWTVKRYHGVSNKRTGPNKCTVNENLSIVLNQFKILPLHHVSKIQYD